MARQRKSCIDPKEQQKLDFIKALQDVGYTDIKNVDTGTLESDDLYYYLTEIKVLGSEYQVMPVYIDDDFTIYLAKSMFSINSIEPDRYYFFSQYTDENIARFVMAVRYTELDKAIRALPDYCHYVNVAVQLKISKLLTFIPFVRNMPEIDFDASKPNKEKQIENMYNVLQDLVLSSSDKVHVREIKGNLYFVLSNADFRILIGNEHLSIKKTLLADKKLLTSGRGRYDYKFSQDETSVMCIKVADENKEIMQHFAYSVKEAIDDSMDNLKETPKENNEIELVVVE